MAVKGKEWFGLVICAHNQKYVDLLMFLAIKFAALIIWDVAAITEKIS